MNYIKYFLVILPLFFFSQDPDIKFDKYLDNKTNVVYADNNEICPISVEYSYSGENVLSSLPNKSIIVVPANAKKFIISRIDAENKSKGFKFSYNVFYVFGDVNSKPSNPDETYWLPYSVGTSQSIYQGYNGNFSHQNAYALDFSHKLGTGIFAARSGKVVTTKSDSDQACFTKDCAKYNNKIIILHDDGTFAEYAHLKKNGVIVNKGDEVKQGQLIGYSGNTGWSKGPHLHFSVFTNKIDGERNYYKTKFKVKESTEPIYLQEQKRYTRNYE
ncbi:murein DD-endopeptidase MepM/ murein hydrolase activator NlpD [Epilithonimonas hungarica]|uniref:M23 family metallopeptidase n=1 Tax=Epilithonimonas hungarica TaxID=454006 RepID=UPI00278A656D|nr:M23 family metallopeptidase [Epilithonimonas hungarica]MDP9954518.1 murein DD-endopeptidase MepM/ murein hydrolase activator NlpD [Epilithonimonas hungarica]